MLTFSFFSFLANFTSLEVKKQTFTEQLLKREKNPKCQQCLPWFLQMTPSLDKVITVYSFKQEKIEAYQEEMSANCEHLSIIT